MYYYGNAYILFRFRIYLILTRYMVYLYRQLRLSQRFANNYKAIFRKLALVIKQLAEVVFYKYFVGNILYLFGGYSHNIAVYLF